MDNQWIYTPGQRPIDNQERRRLPKSFRNGMIFIGVVILMGIAAYFIYGNRNQNQDPEQSLDNEEAIYVYARENSRIVDTEAIVNYAGLSEAEYEQMLDKFDEFFNKEYPEEKYFTLVGDTLEYTKITPRVITFELESSSGQRFSAEIITGSNDRNAIIKIEAKKEE